MLSLAQLRTNLHHHMSPGVLLIALGASSTVGCCKRGDSDSEAEKEKPKKKRKKRKKPTKKERKRAKRFEDKRNDEMEVKDYEDHHEGAIGFPRLGEIHTKATGLPALLRENGPRTPIVARIPDGTTVNVVGKRGHWLHTSYNGKWGYVHQEIVILKGKGRNETPPAPPPRTTPPPRTGSRYVPIPEHPTAHPPKAIHGSNPWTSADSVYLGGGRKYGCKAKVVENWVRIQCLKSPVGAAGVPIKSKVIRKCGQAYVTDAAAVSRYGGRSSATVELRRRCKTSIGFDFANASYALYIDWTGSKPKLYFDNFEF